MLALTEFVYDPDFQTPSAGYLTETFALNPMEGNISVPTKYQLQQ